MAIECEFCGKVLKTEAGAAKHACRQKKFADSTSQVSLARAFYLFDFWFRYNGVSKKPKTFEQFSKSPYLGVFISLEEFSKRMRVSGRAYVKWLSDEHVPSRKWSDESVCANFRRASDVDPLVLTLASLSEMAKWCDERDVDMSDFFRKIAPGEAVMWASDGKLTAWVVFLTESSLNLFERMSAEQQQKCFEALDMEGWESRSEVEPESVERVRSVLAEMGL